MHAITYHCGVLESQQHQQDTSGELISVSEIQGDLGIGNTQSLRVVIHIQGVLVD